MKKSGIFVLPAFALSNAVFLSLGFECLFNLLGIAMAATLDSSAAREYPRFIPFCVVMGIVALVGLVVTYIINLKLSKRLGFTSSLWFVQYILAFALSMPMIRIWIRLFEYLQNTF